jgi:DNA replication and repair protein RecF
MEIEGRNARVFASQGQQRTAALSWKLAEVSVIEQVMDRPPLLLLDDVMSELDENRRHALAEWVSGSVQTVITTTNLHYFDPEMLEAGRVVSLGGAQV